MKKYFLGLFGITGLFLFAGSSVFAQGMMGGASLPPDDHTAREEAEGKEVWERLQDKQTTCAELTAEDYEALGEYFMGRMLGSSHSFMNQMMMQRMGEEGEEKMHEVMGRRMSGCNSDAAFPNEGADFMPMINMMLGTYGGQGMVGGETSGKWNPFSMMPAPYRLSGAKSGAGVFGYPMGFGGGLFMVLWWILIIVAIVALVRWLVGQGKSGEKGRALEILKERYAKGEIKKEEFEKMKRDIN